MNGGILKQGIQRVLGDAFFAAVRVVPVDVQRQPSDGLGQNAHTSIDCRGLHGSPLVDCFAAGCASEQERECVADTVLGFIAGTEQAGKDAQMSSPPKSGYKKRTTPKNCP